MSVHKRYLWVPVLAILVLGGEWKMSWAKEGARNELLINGVPVDVKRDEPGTQDQQKDEDKGQRKWVVQFNGPIRDADKRQLEQLGCTIHEYLPEFAFVVTMTGEVKKKAAALPFVEGVARFTPEHKLNGKLREKVAKPQGESITVQLKLDGAAGRKQVTAGVQRLKGRILDVGRDTLRAELPVAAIAQLAALEEVLWIAEHVEMELFNDSMRWVIQTNTLNDTAIWGKGIHGEGELVGIGDSGLDYDTPWARDAGGAPVGTGHRKVVGYDTRYGDDYDADSPGHGTHVFGTVAGDRTSVDGLDSANGMAPKAKVFIQDLTPGASSSVYPPDDLGLLFGTAYGAGARLLTNSWGNSDRSYSIYAQTADRYLWEHKELVALFSNGNDGPGSGTVGNPATAKNVISVGATLNGSSAGSVASFSSNGPTADGRIKPTVTAPGQGIVSADSDGLKNSLNSGTITMSGTSMATPSVAGAAALVRQYFREGFYPLGVPAPGDAFVPSAALVKAVLINSAEGMTGSGTGGSMPGTGQGWGRINLSRVLVFAADSGRLAIASVDPGLPTGGSWSRGYAVPAGQPLKVTLVWTDYPGAVGAAKALVNDLDLTVTTPDGTTLFGNAFANGVSYAGGAPDRLNVEEQVLIPAPAAGSYTVTVSGYNIPSGPQPFAVVVTGVSGVTSKGSISLDRGRYRSDGEVVVKLADRDLNLDPKVEEQAAVHVQSSSEPGGKTVMLRETSADSSIFSTVVPLAASPAAGTEGALQVGNGDTITVTYSDDNVGGGGKATVTVTALVDDVPPVCSALAVTAISDTGATVSWNSNEAAESLLQYGTAQPLPGSMVDRRLLTEHRLVLTALLEAKQYAISAVSTDEAGNSGSCSGSFSTASLPPTLTVNSSRGESTYSSSTIISGTSTDPSGVVSVKINGVPVEYRASDGYFTQEVQLQIGSNNFTVVATDSVGNAAQAVLQVNRRLAPDLFMMVVSSPSEAVQGSAITVNDTVCNKGAGDAGAFRVGFYLSADTSYSAGDILIGSRSVASTTAGGCSTGSAQVTIPSTAPGGSFYLLGYADYQQVLYDADQSNNVVVGNQVTLPHQLVTPPSSITVPETNSTGSIRVSWGGSNVSGATFVLEGSINEGPWAQVASTTATYAYASAASNGSYRFRVKAVKTGYAESSYTTSTNVCVVTLICSAPGAISLPTTNSDGVFKVSWIGSNATGASYVVEYQVNGGEWVYLTNSIYTYLNYTAKVNGSYRFRVKAIKAGFADSSYSVSGDCVVTLACGAPKSVTVPATDSDGIFKVSWIGSNVTDATYVVEYQVNGGEWVYLTSSFTTYLNYTATANGSYSFRVKAVKNGFADSGYSVSGNCVVTLVCGAPGSVSVPTTNSDGIFKVSWTGSNVKDASYVVEYQVDGGEWVYLASSIYTYLNYRATANGSYRFRVKAVKAGFAESGYSVSGNCVVTLACGAPKSVTVPATDSDGTFKVSWIGSNITDAIYVVEYQVNGGEWVYLTSSFTTYLNYTATANGSYSFRVKAVKKGFAESGYSVSGNCVVTLVCSAPGSVSVPTTDSDGVFRVSWIGSYTRDSSYVVEYQVDGGEWRFFANSIYTYLNYTATASGSYRFRVKAIREGFADSGYVYSANSCVVSL